MHLTKDDFDIFTGGRKYLAADTGRINRQVSRARASISFSLANENLTTLALFWLQTFVYCMRLELNSYTHRRITNAMQALEEAGKGADAAVCLSQKITMTNMHMDQIKEHDGPRIAAARAADSAIDWKQMESAIGSMMVAQVQSRLQAEFDRQEARMEMLFRRCCCVGVRGQ